MKKAVGNFWLKDMFHAMAESSQSICHDVLIGIWIWVETKDGEWHTRQEFDLIYAINPVITRILALCWNGWCISLMSQWKTKKLSDLLTPFSIHGSNSNSKDESSGHDFSPATWIPPIYWRSNTCSQSIDQERWIQYSGNLLITWASILRIESWRNRSGICRTPVEHYIWEV